MSIINSQIESESVLSTAESARLKAKDAPLSVEDAVFIARDLSWQVDSLMILNQLNFQIKKNAFVGIIGPNGAGKSSLLRCLFGKNAISSGSLIFDKQKISEYSRKNLAQKIAVVLQEPPTHFDMSVFELVSMGLLPHKPLFSFTNEEDIKSIRLAIENVGLSAKEKHSFNTLSGGEKQRVMLARAIAQKTQVLILDEPTNHLDIEHQIEVLQLIKKMQITVLLSIHDLNMASAFCDQLILMDKGNIICQGSVEQVLTEENLKNVFNVNAFIDQHPFHSGKRITVDFNRQIHDEEKMKEGIKRKDKLARKDEKK